MDLKQRLDMLLGGATAAGAVPGGVVAATDHDGTLYEAGFAERVLEPETALHDCLR